MARTVTWNIGSSYTFSDAADMYFSGDALGETVEGISLHLEWSGVINSIEIHYGSQVIYSDSNSSGLGTYLGAGRSQLDLWCENTNGILSSTSQGIYVSATGNCSVDSSSYISLIGVGATATVTDIEITSTDIIYGTIGASGGTSYPSVGLSVRYSLSDGSTVNNNYTYTFSSSSSGSNYLGPMILAGSGSESGSNGGGNIAQGRLYLYTTFSEYTDSTNSFTINSTTGAVTASSEGTTEYTSSNQRYSEVKCNLYVNYNPETLDMDSDTFTTYATVSQSYNTLNTSTKYKNTSGTTGTNITYGTPTNVTIGSGLTAGNSSATLSATVTNTTTWYYKYSSGSYSSLQSSTSSGSCSYSVTSQTFTSSGSSTASNISRFSVSGTTLSHTSMGTNTGTDSVTITATNTSSSSATATKSTTVTNTLSWETPTISCTTPVTMSAAGDTKTMSPSITQTGTYTSGSTTTNTSASYSYAVQTAVTGYSLSGSSVTVTANTSTSARNGYVVRITATGNGSKTATKDITFNQSGSNSISIPNPAAAAVNKTYDGNTYTLDFYSCTGASITKYRYSADSGSTWTEITSKLSYSNVCALYVQAYYSANAGYTGSGWSNSVSFVINRLPSLTKPTAKTDLVYSGSAQTGVNNYSQTGMSTSGSYSGTNAGSYSFTGTPDSNHAWTDGTTSAVTVSWSIAKATPTLSVTLASDLIYNGNSRALVTAASVTGGGAIYTGIGSSTTSAPSSWAAWSSTSCLATNAGTYYIWAKADESTNYNAVSQVYKGTTYIGLKSPTIKIGMVGYTYGGTKTNPAVSTNESGGTVTYYYNTSNSNSGGTAWSNVTSSTSLNAGTYYMYATVAATGNYSSNTSATVSFTISQASGATGVSTSDMIITYSTTSATRSVSGNTGTVTVSSSDTNVATASISGTTITVTRKGYGSATITCTAAESTNYKTETSPFTVYCNRQSRSGTVSCNDVTYGSTVTATVSGNTESGTITWGITNGTGKATISSSGVVTPTQAGTVTVTASVAQTTNYLAYTATSKTITIGTASWNLSTFSTTGPYTYNGSAQGTFNIKSPLGGTVYFSTSSISAATSYSQSVTANTATTYTHNDLKYTNYTTGVTRYARGYQTGNSNYNTWSNSASTTIVINKLPSLTKPTAKTGLVYSGSAQIGVNNYSQTGMSTSGSYSGTNAGSYSFTGTPDSNHAWSDGTTSAVTVSWSIANKSISIPTPTDYDNAYDGSAHGATFSACTGATITSYRYSTDKTNWTTSTSNPTWTTVGTYYSQAYYTASTNYTGSDWSSTATVTISKAATASASAANKTYNGSAQTGVTGSGVTWSGTTSATNAGTYTSTTYTAYATPDSNHTWSDGTSTQKTIRWTMSAADPGTLTVADIWVNFDGNAHCTTASMSTSIAGKIYYDTTNGGKTYYITSSTTSQNLSSVTRTDAGTTTVYATFVPDNTNYLQKTDSDSIVIYKIDQPGTVVTNSPVYGSGSNLVKIGTAFSESPSVYYCVGTQLTSSNYTSAGSTTVPTTSGRVCGTTYTVYYYAPTTTNYKEKSGSVNVTLSQSAGTTGVSTSDMIITYSTTSATRSVSGNTGTVTVSSSDTNVATASISGTTITVTRKGYGSATITCTAAESTNYKTATSPFTVYCKKADQPMTISVSKTTIYNTTGYNTSQITPSSNQGTVTYSSSDATIATVSSTGVVTYVKAGTVTITVTAAGNDNYNSGSKTCTVNCVIDTIINYDYNSSNSSYTGSVSISWSTALSAGGGTGTVTASASHTHTYYYLYTSGSTSGPYYSYPSDTCAISFASNNTTTKTSGRFTLSSNSSGATITHSSMKTDTSTNDSATVYVYNTAYSSTSSVNNTGTGSVSNKIETSQKYKDTSNTTGYNITYVAPTNVTIGSGLTAGGGSATLSATVTNTTSWYYKYTSGSYTSAYSDTEAGSCSFSVTSQTFTPSGSSTASNISRFSVSGTTLSHTTMGTNVGTDSVTITATNTGSSSATATASTTVTNTLEKVEISLGASSIPYGSKTTSSAKATFTSNSTTTLTDKSYFSSSVSGVVSITN